MRLWPLHATRLLKSLRRDLTHSMRDSLHNSLLQPTGILRPTSWKLLVLGSALVFASVSLGIADDVRVMARPDSTQTNRHYISNRLPLQPSALIPLPVGAVQPRGWLRVMLERQRDGLTGYLGEISGWLQKDDNAWLSQSGKGKYGWEEVPYWLRGYIDLAYIFDDANMFAEAKIWIEGALAGQRVDGDFGPDQRLDDGTRDYWGNMLMLYCLQSYHDKTHDTRVLELMSRYFKHQLSVPDNQLLTGYWQKMRGGDNIYSVQWLYNRTGDPELLKLMEKLHRCTANWCMKDDLPNWHNVNIAEAFREPAHYYLLTGKKSDLQFAYANFHEIRRRFGQVPGGMFGGDENCRAGYTDPRQGTETCGFVEQMFSDELLLHITGDPFWADQCEEVAFNMYPAAVMPDFRSLRYLTAPNMIVSDSKNHHPGIDNRGPFLMMNPFSSRCCQHNHSFGWPYFNKHLWAATPDNGLCAAIYCASEISAKVSDGARVKIVTETRYPFEEAIQFTVSPERPVTFPLYLRIPAWCQTPQISINGKRMAVKAEAGKFVRLEREWRRGEIVTLKLPMAISLRQWARNQGSVSVDYGPLTFSLKIGERYDRRDSKQTAIGDSSWQPGADASKWPSYEIHPTTPWNYGLVLDQKKPTSSFKLKKRGWPKDDFPFTTESAPLAMTVNAKQIPEWKLDRHGLCAPLQASPAFSAQPTETVTLVPMGAARLRIASFPTVSSAPLANRWQAD